MVDVSLMNQHMKELMMGLCCSVGVIECSYNDWLTS